MEKTTKSSKSDKAGKGKKPDIREKTLKYTAIAILAAIVFGLILVASDFSSEYSQNENTERLGIYFLNPLNNEIEQEFRNITKGDQKVMLEDILAEFIMGPKSETLVKTYPDSFGKVDVVLVSPVSDSENNKTVEIVFPPEYYNLSKAEEIVLRACLVYTLTGLPFVKNVEILVSDPETPSLKKVLMRSNNQPLGRAGRESIHISPDITSDKFVRKYVTLYFANKELTGLVPEVRIIDAPSDSLEEWIILEQLIKGPNSENLVNLWPADLQVKDVRVDNKVCYIDLSGSIDANNSNGLLVYSIVNTLAMPDVNVKRVQFLVNGEKLNPEVQTIEKDEGLILGNLSE